MLLFFLQQQSSCCMPEEGKHFWPTWPFDDHDIKWSNKNPRIHRQSRRENQMYDLQQQDQYFCWRKSGLLNCWKSSSDMEHICQFLKET
jgi:hypothetical protein